MTVSSETAAQPPPSNGGAADGGPAPGIAGDVSAEMAGLENRPIEEHPDVYEAISRRLGETLSGIDHV